MTYKELQQALKPYKEDGQTNITLNSPKPMLEAEYERLTVAKTQETEAELGELCHDCHKCDGAGTVVGFDWSDMSYPDVECEESGYINEAIDKNAGKISQPEDNDIFPFDPLKPTLDLMSGIEPPNAEEPDLFEIENDDELTDKIDDFFLAVKRGQLSSEQLEAVTLAMVVAHRKHTNLSMELAYLKKFHHFSPNQLLAWGFDQIIPAEGLLIQLRNAIASTIKPTTLVNVSVYVNAGDEEKTALLELWASSYGGKSWYTGMGEGLFEEGWEFPSIESAEKFTEYCQKLEFVVAAKIDRISSNVAVPPQKLTELKTTVTQ